MNIVDRLDANSIWEPNSGCRIWLGALNNDHGVMKVRGQQEQVHRVAWEVENGPIPNGLWVLHSCGLGACLNVAHLRLGHRAENARDRMRHGGYRGAPGGGLQIGPRIIDVREVKKTRQSDAPFSHDELRRIISYDPDTGIFHWRTRADRDHSWNMRFSGEVAGSTLSVGYVYINFNTKLRTAHRLAWFYMTGEWPTGQVDHINRDRADNRWSNLRLATQKQNSANQGLRTTNTSGAKGVSWITGKGYWRAQIMIDGKTRFLGYFAAFEAAKAARRAAESEYHGAFASQGTH